MACIISDSGDRDSIPVVMMEAMAMGLPVISINVSRIPELVNDVIIGILVPPKDKKSVAKAMIKLCKDKQLHDEMGETELKIIERDYNWSF